MFAPAEEGASRLLVAPTGGGKTLAGFLPSLVELSGGCHAGLHTLYVSPLKALAADMRRNLTGPVAEMDLPIRIEDRTGDTSSHAKRRQRADPPHILLTTPESLAILLSQPEAPRFFAGLERVIVDEIHALAGSKRGDQLALCLARLATLAPRHRRVALSATVEDPAALGDWLARKPGTAEIIQADPGPPADIAMIDGAGTPPWAGQGGRYAVQAVMEEIRRVRSAIVFINTRAQAELFFRALWQVNEDNLPIGLHHGSLAREARQRVEAAMAAGELRAVVATGSLDLGLDWGDVDLVIQVGAPKAVKRLVQRIGRANHRYDAPSRALLVPANRFEVLECRAALDAVAEDALDGETLTPGGRDVLCQHILLMACAGPFHADALFGEVTSAGPYRALDREAFDACLSYCATGGYALRAYDQWQRLMQQPDGLWRLRDPRSASRIRMNAGTIVGTETVNVQLGRGPKLGEVEEDFAAQLSPGETFLIGGEVVEYEGMREMSVQVRRAPGREPKIAVFMGTKLATSVQLSERIVGIMSRREEWAALPEPVRNWLEFQADISELPTLDEMLVETFPRGDRWFLAAYGFAGRNAMQTLGLLVTKRMEDARLAPLGFLATDYALLVWGLDPVDDPAPLFDARGLREGLETWLAGNQVMKRTFRNVAIVAGLIDRRLPGHRKTGKQATFSSDILYDTLRKYDPGHLLLQVTQEEARRGLVDFGRIEEMLARYGGRVRHVRAPHVTPLAAPLMLEVGRVSIKGAAEERLLDEEMSILSDAGLPNAS